MNPDFQRRVQRYGWNKAVTYYEPAWKEQLRPAQECLLERAALRPGERVLDVAAGTGLVTLPAASKVGPGGEVLAVDLSEEMVVDLRKKAEERGLGHVRVERMDAEALDVPEASFEVALCSLGLMYLPDPVEALRQMQRALVPGGRAVAVVWGQRERCGWAEVFPIVDRRVASEVCPLFFQLGTGRGLEAAFKAAGFEEVKGERFSVALHYDTPEAACDAAFWGGAVALAWQKFDEETRQSAEKDYLESIAPFRNGSGYDIPGEFVVVSGRKRSKR